jgi:hypothetical protein
LKINFNPKIWEVEVVNKVKINDDDVWYDGNSKGVLIPIDQYKIKSGKVYIADLLKKC